MSRSTKKQQQKTSKKQKARAEKRRRLRHAAAVEMAAPPDHPFGPRASQTEQKLRSSIQRFCLSTAYAADFDVAMKLYFGEGFKQAVAINGDSPVFADFQEWYFFDFVTAQGNRLIEQFAEKVGPSLPPGQKQMLDDWMRTNRLRLLEIQAVTPGVGEVAKDLLSGEIIEALDITMSTVARKWMVVLARPLFTEGRWRFTGAGHVFTPMEKPELVDFARSLWEDYRAQHPGALLDAFYRDRSIQLHKFAEDLQFRLQNPAYFTAEYHPVIQAIAQYRVLDLDEVLARLDNSEEFNFAGESEIRAGAEHYNWLLRGRSHVPAAEEPADPVTVLRTEWTLGPGEPSYLSLGDLTVAPDTMELECMSRERLAVGRQLLEGLLAGQIVPLGDSYSEIIASSRKLPAVDAPRLSNTNPDAWQVEQESLARAAAVWLDSPLPMLDDQTPREAAKTESGRALLEDAFKTLEFIEEENPRLRTSPYSARALRRALGLDS